LEFGQKMAEITIEPITKQVIKVDFQLPLLRFKCQRCAVFCCKLGGPRLLPKDIERLKRAGVSPNRFLNAEQTSMESRKDGSCIFLSFNTQEDLYSCSIHDQRPTFCRLYPFQFEKSGLQSYSLSFIPCCNGLNNADGEAVDAKFFTKFLKEILYELIDSEAV